MNNNREIKTQNYKLQISSKTQVNGRAMARVKMTNRCPVGGGMGEGGEMRFSLQIVDNVADRFGRHFAGASGFNP